MENNISDSKISDTARFFKRIRFVDSIAEDYVWIGAGANILQGISIGDGAVIGAGAIITHDIGGVP